MFTSNSLWDDPFKHISHEGNQIQNSGVGVQESTVRKEIGKYVDKSKEELQKFFI